MMLPARVWKHALSGSTVILSLSSTSQATDYVQHTMTAIEELNLAWYNPSTGIWNGAWWNSANALTTLADFANLRRREANELNIGGIIRNTYFMAQKTNVQTTKSTSASGMTSTTNCLNCTSTRRSLRWPLRRRGFADFLNEYYDDEGWWALGLIRAYDATGDQDYLNSAVDIFSDMQTGQGTPCGGGIYWNKDRRYVNAIANELYLSVAASLANRVSSNSSTYLGIALSQWKWFENSGMINSRSLINDGLDSACKNNGLTTWSYNQGVILGGLSELAMATNDRSFLTRAIAIANAAINALSNKDGVLVEADQCELRPGNCGMDGQQFKGIFVRNLRYLNALAPSDTFRSFILRNADSIWDRDRNSVNKLGVSWPGPYVDATGPSHSSALDALVAAVAVS